MLRAAVLSAAVLGAAVLTVGGCDGATVTVRVGDVCDGCVAGVVVACV